MASPSVRGDRNVPDLVYPPRHFGRTISDSNLKNELQNHPIRRSWGSRNTEPVRFLDPNPFGSNDTHKEIRSESVAGKTSAERELPRGSVTALRDRFDRMDSGGPVKSPLNGTREGLSPPKATLGGPQHTRSVSSDAIAKLQGSFGKTRTGFLEITGKGKELTQNGFDKVSDSVNKLSIRRNNSTSNLPKEQQAPQNPKALEEESSGDEGIVMIDNEIDQEIDAICTELETEIAQSEDTQSETSGAGEIAKDTSQRQQSDLKKVRLNYLSLEVIKFIYNQIYLVLHPCCDLVTRN